MGKLVAGVEAKVDPRVGKRSRVSARSELRAGTSRPHAILATMGQLGEPGICDAACTFLELSVCVQVEGCKISSWNKIATEDSWAQTRGC